MLLKFNLIFLKTETYKIFVDKIYIFLGFISVALIIISILYIMYFPNGLEYSNADFIILPAGKITNINSNTSFIINVSNYPTLYFFNKSYVSIGSVNTSKAVIIATPLNSSFYNLILNNETIITPIAEKNITFEIIGSELYTTIYNKLMKYTYIENFQINQNIRSVYTNKNSSVLIFYSPIIKTHPIKIEYYPENATCYQKVDVFCSSNSSFMIISDNLGDEKTFNSGSGSMTVMAYPFMNVSCYNGYEYVQKQINIIKIKPSLTLTYNNETVTCETNMNDSVIYIDINNKTVYGGFGKVSYKINPYENLHISCVIPGNACQEEVTKNYTIS